MSDWCVCMSCGWEGETDEVHIYDDECQFEEPSMTAAQCPVCGDDLIL